MLTPEELQKLKDANIGEPAGSTPMTSKPSPYKSLSDELSNTPAPAPSFLDKTINVAKGIGSAVISNEQNFANDISAAATNILPEKVTGEAQLKEAQAAKEKSLQIELAGLKKARETGGDTQKWLKMLSDTTGSDIPTMEDLYPAIKKTNLQVAGDAAGVLVDILSAGSYGNAAKLGKTGELYKAIPIAQVANKTAAPALSATLKTIGKETVQRSAVGAGTGYAYDVSNNLQEGKTGTEAVKPGLGTVAGAVIPALAGIYQGTKAVTKATAPKFINSLIKPKLTEFSYGKDPGRTVAELGITGNDLEDFGKNVSQHKQDIGSMLNASYQHATDQGVKVDLTPIIDTFDQAIQDTAKGGKSNQYVATALQNAKDALLFEHSINKDGIIEKIGDIPKDLSKLTPLEAFDTKSILAGQTKFTGNPSDDKTINAVLKKAYGQIKEELNKKVSTVSPEVPDLNQKYADLVSAELAIANRDAILKRANIVPFFAKVGGAAGLVGLGTAAFSGVGLIPILTAAGAAGVESLLASAAYKTRMAKWLGNTSPTILNKFFMENPGIKEAIYRTIPKAASLIHKEPQTN